MTNCGCNVGDSCISKDCNCTETGICTCGPDCKCEYNK